MKKLLVIVSSLIFLLGGWSSNKFDISPYVGYEVEYPTVTADAIDSLTLDVTFDYKQLEEDYVSSGQVYTQELEQVLNKLEFNINGIAEDEYNWLDSKFVIKPINREILNDYNLKIDRKFVLKTTSEQYQTLLDNFAVEKEQLAAYIDSDDQYSYQVGVEATKKLEDLTSRTIPLENAQSSMDSYKPEIKLFYNDMYFQYLQSTTSEDIPLYTMTAVDNEIVGDNVVYYIFKQNVTINNVDLVYTSYITDHMGNITTAEFPASAFSNKLEDEPTGSKIIFISDSSNSDQNINNIIVRTGAVYTWFSPESTVEEIVSYIQEFATTTNISELQAKYQSKNTKSELSSDELILYIRDIINPIIGQTETLAYHTIYAPYSIFYKYFKSALYVAIEEETDTLFIGDEHAEKYSELGSIPLDS